MYKPPQVVALVAVLLVVSVGAPRIAGGVAPDPDNTTDGRGRATDYGYGLWFGRLHSPSSTPTWVVPGAASAATPPG